MRVLQQYRFLIGTKIPFEKWPGIIEEYLTQQGLHHRAFHYHMENFDHHDDYLAVLNGKKCKTCHGSDCENCRKYAERMAAKRSPCERASKEHPFLGPIHTEKQHHSTLQTLHNFDENSNDAKMPIYAILSKIYRRYGFTETSLIYRDIDFFSRWVNPPAPGGESLCNGYLGSGITLYRSISGSNNCIILTVESPYPGVIPDARPYADALEKLLPGSKKTVWTKLLMDPEEASRYEALHAQAKPLIAQARTFFDKTMPEEKGNTDLPVRVSCAAWLKKMARQFGYIYEGYHNYTYSMTRKLPGGHAICLEFVSTPSDPCADPFVNLCGLGFHHWIWSDGFSPQNPQDAADYFPKLFRTLEQAEKTVFLPILSLYPETPDWYVPSRNPLV